MANIKTGYYVREGVSSIFTHGFMSFASVFIIVACLIIMGSFSLLAVNVNNIIGEFESENIILAYVGEGISVEEARALKSDIEAVPNVKSAQFTSREEAMETFISKFDDKERFKNIDASVLRHRFSIYVEDVANMAQTQIYIRDIPGIAKVNANLLIAKGFVTIRNIVSGVSVVLVAILLIISLFIMSNTIKLATFERREEIAIMKMVGATNAFIRWPFAFEGFILGLLGSLFAFLAQWGLYLVVSEAIINNGTFGSSGLLHTIPFSHVALPLFIVFVAIGFGVGIIGSNTAIRKYLKV
jgi:cell division transport system permease protein